MRKKKKFKHPVCKPCWELNYCPYGPMVEDYPLIDEVIDVALIEEEYEKAIQGIADGRFKTESDVWHAIERVEYLWPPTWKMLEQYDYTELQCIVFGHVCPIFFNAEPLTETNYKRRWGQSRYVPREIMLKVVRRDGQICQICHRNVPDDQLAFDHVIPASKGGPTTVNNLRVVCVECNSQKRDSLGELLKVRRS